MRAFFIVTLAGCLLPLTAAAEDFHIETLAPGQAPNSACHAGYWRQGLHMPDDQVPPYIFEAGKTAGYIKIDRTVHTLDPVAADDPAGPKLYRDADVTVARDTRIYRVDEADALYLRGALSVTFNGRTQSVAVEGMRVCFAGSS
jgi:hypothetical protein